MSALHTAQNPRPSIQTVLVIVLLVNLLTKKASALAQLRTNSSAKPETALASKGLRVMIMVLVL
jgi:hypothetical protein